MSGKSWAFLQLKMAGLKLWRLTIVEYKPIGGIYLNWFNNLDQEKFHSHAFSGRAFLFCGNYLEEIFTRNRRYRTVKRKRGTHKLRNNLVHRILNAKHVISLNIVGPWDKYWFEDLTNGKRQWYTWGRVKIKRPSVVTKPSSWK